MGQLEVFVAILDLATILIYFLTRIFFQNIRHIDFFRNFAKKGKKVYTPILDSAAISNFWVLTIFFWSS
jgi:hypothetical protein